MACAMEINESEFSCLKMVTREFNESFIDDVQVISGHLGWVRCVDVEPGNEWFATGAGDRIVKVSCRFRWRMEGEEKQQSRVI